MRGALHSRKMQGNWTRTEAQPALGAGLSTLDITHADIARHEIWTSDREITHIQATKVPSITEKHAAELHGNCHRHGLRGLVDRPRRKASAVVEAPAGRVAPS